MNRSTNPTGKTASLAPDLSAEEGWQALDGLMRRFGSQTFVSGDVQSDRLQVRYYQRFGDGALVGKAWFGPKTQGPPGHAHGGSQTAVMDEALGAAAWLAGHPCFTARLTHHFREMIPLGTIAHFEAAIDRIENRKIFVSGRLHDAGGRVYAETEGLFLKIKPERMTAIAGRFARSDSPTSSS